MPKNGKHCVVPDGWVDWQTTDRFPATWRPLPDAADWVESSRRGGVVQRTDCERLWFLFHDPKEMFSTGIFELPATSMALLRPGSLASGLRAMDAIGGRFHDGLAAAWLGGASCDLGDCASALLRGVREARNLDDSWRWHFSLRSSLSGSTSFWAAVKAARARGRQPLSIRRPERKLLARLSEQTARLPLPRRRSPGDRIDSELESIEEILERWSEPSPA